MTKHLRELQRTITDCGGIVVSVTRNKHYKLRVRAPDGREKIFVTSVSPSDVSSEHNNRARIKRFLAQ